MHLDPSKIPGYVKGQPPDRELFRKISFMDELEAMWGRKWGAQSKLGKLRYALVHRFLETDHMRRIPSS